MTTCRSLPESDGLQRAADDSASNGVDRLPPSVDVVVLTWNDRDLLQECLDSVAASVGTDLHVIVVDNGSDPPAQLPDDPRLTLLRNEQNRGVAAARNQGAAAGSSPFVLFLDSDAKVDPENIRDLVNTLVRDPGLALVGPVFKDQRPEESGGRAPTLSTKLRRLVGRTSTYEPATDQGALLDVDFVIGACQCFRREAWSAVEGLDERYFYGPEDVDFCLRLIDAGWSVAQSTLIEVEHPPRRRNRSMFTKRGVKHSLAVVQFLWRARGFSRRHDR